MKRMPVHQMAMAVTAVNHPSPRDLSARISFLYAALSASSLCLEEFVLGTSGNSGPRASFPSSDCSSLLARFLRRASARLLAVLVETAYSSAVMAMRTAAAKRSRHGSSYGTTWGHVKNTDKSSGQDTKGCLVSSIYSV